MHAKTNFLMFAHHTNKTKQSVTKTTSGQIEFVSCIFTGFTCFVVILLFAVVSGISMYRCSPSRGYIAAHSHKLDHLQFESMNSVAHLLRLLQWPPLLPVHRQNYNYYCYFDCCCCAIASTALKWCLISLDSLFATLVPLPNANSFAAVVGCVNQQYHRISNGI